MNMDQTYFLFIGNAYNNNNKMFLWLFDVLFVGIEAGVLASARNLNYYHKHYLLSFKP